MITKRRERENRRSPRVEVSKGVWVAWRTDGSPSVSRVRDLSAGGVFISTNSPLSQGASVQLLFSLPEGEVRVEGIVRYAQKGSGMGVEFVRMGMADRARLQELIRRLNS
ncbi:MAG TPA: PilZ domain-containing protein [Candidatus Aquilonibacter sp.]|nr:PilZ domain-containing protein [Candidatus Aquilonibacter sp.]